ncbi:MAG: hypothetical protein ABIN91_11185 [Mucilaginibacter sp.]|uniref:hypothetical protein n=1 Tax=Mucilaginibacter sp. TaxID=1882438 RepID=UPI003263458A
MKIKTALEMVEESTPFFVGDMVLLMEKYAAQFQPPTRVREAALFEIAAKVINQYKTSNLSIDEATVLDAVIAGAQCQQLQDVLLHKLTDEELLSAMQSYHREQPNVAIQLIKDRIKELRAMPTGNDLMGHVTAAIMENLNLLKLIE